MTTTIQFKNETADEKTGAPVNGEKKAKVEDQMIKSENVTTKPAAKPVETKEAVKTETKAVEKKPTVEEKVVAAEKKIVAAEKKIVAAEKKVIADKVTEKKTAVKKAVEKKTVEKKVDEKKVPVKRTVRKKADAAIYVQYMDQEVAQEELVKRIVEKWCKATGKKESSIKEFSVYIKPEDNAAYYVINGQGSSITLY